MGAVWRRLVCSGALHRRNRQSTRDNLRAAHVQSTLLAHGVSRPIAHDLATAGWLRLRRRATLLLLRYRPHVKLKHGVLRLGCPPRLTVGAVDRAAAEPLGALPRWHAIVVPHAGCYRRRRSDAVAAHGRCRHGRPRRPWPPPSPRRWHVPCRGRHGGGSAPATCPPVAPPHAAALALLVPPAGARRVHGRRPVALGAAGDRVRGGDARAIADKRLLAVAAEAQRRVGGRVDHGRFGLWRAVVGSARAASGGRRGERWSWGRGRAVIRRRAPGWPLRLPATP